MFGVNWETLKFNERIDISSSFRQASCICSHDMFMLIEDSTSDYIQPLYRAIEHLSTQTSQSVSKANVVASDWEVALISW